MGANLSVIELFCDNKIKEGKIIPLSFDFPAFGTITEQMYKATTIDVISEKVRLGIDFGNYKENVSKIVDQQVVSGLKSKEYGVQFSNLMDGFDYDSLIESQNAVNNGLANKNQKNQIMVADKMLAIQFEKDPNLNPIEISRKTISELCSSRMKSCVVDLDFLSNLHDMNDFPSSRGKVAIESEEKKLKFAATMIMMKEQMPSVYSQINDSLKNFENKDLIKELKTLEKEPNRLVIQQIYECDKKFAEKIAPKISHEISDENTNFKKITANKKI